jgi:hypothetical protein
MRASPGITLVVFLAGAIARSGAAQERVELSNYCVYNGEEIEGDVYGFASDREASEALNRVMRYSGLASNFVIKAANVPNAVASIEGTQRLILYNQNFMLQVRSTTSTNWSSISILAHEIGHHLQGHTLQPGGSRPEIELEADDYSGFILQRMGASLDQAQVVMKTFGSDQGSETHPAKSARLAAITNGWIKAKELAQTKPDTSAPERTAVPQPEPTPTQPQPRTPVYVSRAVFPADANAYFITSNDDIVGVVAATGQTVIVGKRIAPTLPGFAWMYYTAQVTYGVTPDGRILSRDQFGNMFQVGYVTNP